MAEAPDDAERLGEDEGDRAPARPPPPGVNALALPAEEEGARGGADAEAANGSVTLVVRLPSGAEETAAFDPGQLVGYVKAFLARKHTDLVLSKLQLHVVGEGDVRKLMLDPLSIVDCPGCSPGATVRVDATLAT